MGQPTEGALIALAMKVGKFLFPFNSIDSRAQWLDPEPHDWAEMFPILCPVPHPERLRTRVEGVGCGFTGMALCFGGTNNRRGLSRSFH